MTIENPIMEPTCWSFKFTHPREIQLMLMAMNRLDQSLLSSGDQEMFELMQDCFKEFALDPDEYE